MVFILKMRRNLQKIFNENTYVFFFRKVNGKYDWINLKLIMFSLIIIRCPAVLFPITNYILLQGKFLI